MLECLLGWFEFTINLNLIEKMHENILTVFLFVQRTCSSENVEVLGRLNRKRNHNHNTETTTADTCYTCPHQ